MCAEEYFVGGNWSCQSQIPFRIGSSWGAGLGSVCGQQSYGWNRLEATGEEECLELATLVCFQRLILVEAFVVAGCPTAAWLTSFVVKRM
jgi:hypothetical protein